MAGDDIDGGLLQAFSCLGTTDRDVLISEFKRYIGSHLTDNVASFYLDMSNWNLQVAICTYLDTETTEEPRLPSMKFVGDVTIGEGECVPPNTNFVKTWRVANTGEVRWPQGCVLHFSDGDKMCPEDTIPVPELSPGQQGEISWNMRSPAAEGMFQSRWRMATPDGHFFGDVIWMIVSVNETGTLALTQQLSNLPLGQSPPAVFGGDQRMSNFDPFCRQPQQPRNPLLSQPLFGPTDIHFPRVPNPFASSTPNHMPPSSSPEASEHEMS